MHKILILLTLLSALPASARIEPISLDNLVKQSDFIAVVDILEVQQPSKYEQLGFFKAIRILKGKSNDGHQVYCGDITIGARPDYHPGRYLVFLRKEAGKLIATYHAYSVFEVKNEKIDWFADSNSTRRQETSLEKAEVDIRNLLP